MNIRIRFHYSKEIDVSLSVDKLKDIVEKQDVGDSNDLSEIEACVANDVLQKMRLTRTGYPHDTVSPNERKRQYENILKDDAESRMRHCFDRKEISVEDFVSWCWDHNAGHWPDGTPIMDD